MRTRSAKCYCAAGHSYCRVHFVHTAVHPLDAVAGRIFAASVISLNGARHIKKFGGRIEINDGFFPRFSLNRHQVRLKGGQTRSCVPD
jgi:hypothetical protein